MNIGVTLYVFQGPHSYTGEDIIEFHLPGNPLLAKLLLDELIRGGARPAEAGEFTARAYFHGRMDLTQAEGVAAAIGAHGEQELRAARQLLSGELARRLRPVMDLLAQTLALVEVGIDFTEEDVSFLSVAEIAHRVTEADRMLGEIVEQSARFEKISHEPTAVLVGRPNAGKSTLLNALAGRERAVVSAVAGTTRDAVSAEIVLRRGMLRLVDVAGIDEAESQVFDEGENSVVLQEIERRMRERALEELERADLVILVEDGSLMMEPIALPRGADLRVMTKSDLFSRLACEPCPVASEAVGHGPQAARLNNSLRGGEIHVSAHTGVNIDLLREKLDELAFGSATIGATLALNSRHLLALSVARESLGRAAAMAAGGREFLALELRESLDELGAILGSISPDDLLGRIFSSFCIGK